MSRFPERELGETADPELVEQQREKSKLTLAQQDADLMWLMKSAEGRRAVSVILRWCKVGSVGFDPNDRVEAFWLGEKNVGHRLLKELKRINIAGVRLMEDEEVENDRRGSRGSNK